MINEFLDPKAVSFKEVNREDVKPFIEKHYLGAYPSAIKLYIGIFYNESMVGMIIYGSPTAAQAAQAIFSPEAGMNHRNVSELKRLYLTDDENILPLDAKKNLAGYAISKGNEIASNKFPEVKVILTYSNNDTHSGSVYKATNAVYQGERDGKKRWVYPVGSPSQKRWVLKNLKSNIDWESTNESLDILRQMWKDSIVD